MGADRQTQESQQYTKTQTTPMEDWLGQQQQQQLGAYGPIAQNLYGDMGSILSQILGGQDLPGNLSGLAGGISPELTTEMAQKAVGDVQPWAQSQGLLDSGTNLALSGQVAGDIRRQAGQFNIQNLMNLLNMGMGGAMQAQQFPLQQSQLLSQRLAGLRPTTQQGSQTTTAMNPFLKSFQQGLGQGLGQGISGGIGSIFGGF